MSKTNDGGPAFPQHGWSSDPEVLRRMNEAGEGMTLRDWFAATLDMNWVQALSEEELIDMAPHIATPLNATSTTVDRVRRGLFIRAQLRYMAADAMIAAREGGAK